MVLARLAVDKEFQGRSVGRGLMKDTFQRILSAAGVVGAKLLLVHPMDQEAEAYHSAYGFKPLPGETKTLFLPIATLAAAL
jgi:predicted N-acetyltransferase YhbS